LERSGTLPERSGTLLERSERSATFGNVLEYGVMNNQYCMEKKIEKIDF